MSSLITVAVPIYKRFEYLPKVFESIRNQDYPNIDLLVSDNGQNGDAVAKMVEQYYGKPFRFRQNPHSVNISQHFNQLVEAARGEYFVLLSDDDEISPNFLSALYERLHNHPEIGVAIGRVTTMDEHDTTLSLPDVPPPPASMTALEFTRLWGQAAYPFVSFVTNMSRTAEIRAAGSYQDFPSGNCIDNCLLTKLIVGRSIAYCHDAIFAHRIYPTSTGKAASCVILGQATRMVLEFLDHDPDLRRYARSNPIEWAEMKREIGRIHWYTYLSRWRTMYRERMTYWEWFRAAFAMPWVPEYYNDALRTLAYSIPPLAAVLTAARRLRTG
ncbi:MAG: glycosyltransferase family A protein [Roseiflexaceae bacterium]